MQTFGICVSKSNDGRLVFNAFIDKEYAPRGRLAPNNSPSHHLAEPAPIAGKLAYQAAGYTKLLGTSVDRSLRRNC